MATEKQINVLKKTGLSETEIESMTREQVSEKIGEILKSSYGGEKKSYTPNYAPKTKANIKRVIPEGYIDPDLQEFADAIVRNAYAAAKKEYPDEDENGQQFGMANTKWQYIFTTKLTS